MVKVRGIRVVISISVEMLILLDVALTLVAETSPVDLWLQSNGFLRGGVQIILSYTSTKYSCRLVDFKFFVPTLIRVLFLYLQFL